MSIIKNVLTTRMVLMCEVAIFDDYTQAYVVDCIGAADAYYDAGEYS